MIIATIFASVLVLQAQSTAPITPAASAAADRWSSGAASVSSYVTPAPSAAASATTRTAKRAGIHASISAAVRRTTQYQRDDYDDYYDDSEISAPADDGWTEVSRSKKQPATKSRMTASAPASQHHDDDDYDNDFGSAEYGENM